MKIESLLQDKNYPQKRMLENLICYFLEITREELWLKLDEDLSDDILEKIRIWYTDYVEKKKPLEYVLGFVEFFWTKFFVNENTLIPRPETEYMIQAISEYIKNLDPSISLRSTQDDNLCEKNKNVLMDIGTGCGVLWISVLLQNPDFFDHVFLSDISQDALKVANQNYDMLISKSYDTRIVYSDLFSHAESYESIIENSNIIMTANLPYIPDEAFDNGVGDNVKNWEPRMAFVWWDDWLDYYRQMFDQIFSLQKNVIFTMTMFLEMMTRQVDILRKEFGDKIEFSEVKTFHFNIRIVKAELK